MIGAFSILVIFSKTVFHHISVSLLLLNLIGLSPFNIVYLGFANNKIKTTHSIFIPLLTSFRYMLSFGAKLLFFKSLDSMETDTKSVPQNKTPHSIGYGGLAASAAAAAPVAANPIWPLLLVPWLVSPPLGADGTASGRGTFSIATGTVMKVR